MSEFPPKPLDARIAQAIELLVAAGPTGGPAAALVAALAASLAAAAADGSRRGWDEAAGARAQAQALRQRVLALAGHDATTYAAARAALAQRGGEGDPEARDARLGEAVRLAAEAPLQIGAGAADIAELATLIASHGAAEVRADAAIASVLAAAAARSAAHLVEINLVAGSDPELVGRARAFARAADSAAASVTGQD